jgi:hypothetical protein
MAESLAPSMPDAALGGDRRLTRAAGPSMLVAIASHGRGQDHFLRQVVAQYRELGWPCRIVVLSNIDKPVEGAEVRVGIPTRDPYSLPFAHRQVMAENAGKFDLYIYTEDDTLIKRRNLEAYLALQPQLADDEILGFMRSETRPDGSRVVVTVNHHFRWLPHTVVRRGDGLFAQFSNEHSGCFIATRRHLERALASGGFLVAPRADRYGMLETAASDIYTQCGLRRLISLERLHDFIVPHLANKYHDQMGIPIEEVDAQVEALSRLGRDASSWTGSLLDPKTRAAHFRWSKMLYDAADTSILARIPGSAGTVLSVGAAFGSNERALAARGVRVTAMPLDGVFGARLAAGGLRAIPGPLDQAIDSLGDERFDAVLLVDVLHLVASPVHLLSRLRGLLAMSGRVVGRVPEVPSLAVRIQDASRGRRWRRPSYEREGVHATSPGILREWCRAAGLEMASWAGAPAKGPTGPGLRASIRRRLRDWIVFEASRRDPR